MESDFFDLYNNKSCFALEVGHNLIADWCIYIYDIKDKELSACNKPVISIQHSDRKKAFAMAYNKFTDYLLENRRGY